MTHDPEAAERLARRCKTTAQTLRQDRAYPNAQGVLDDAAALIRAQAAEIERLRDSFDSLEARLHDVGLEPIFDHEGLARATRAIDTPTPQPKPSHWMPMPEPPKETPDATLPQNYREYFAVQEALEDTLRRITGIHEPAPQPDADEREAMAEVIEAAWDDDLTGGRSMALIAADALLAAGWTRKREEG